MHASSLSILSAVPGSLARPAPAPTPMVAVTVAADGDLRTVWLKLEGSHRYGSIKTRTAESLVDALEQDGRIRPGMQIVESTSGNLGVALAGIARERGYRFLAVVDPRTSSALLARMRALGGEVDMVSEPDGTGGYLLTRLRRVRDLVAARRDRVWCDQYGNPANPRAHERGTAVEIASQTGGAVDAVFVAVSTGGTLAGVGSYLRRHHPGCRVVGVDIAGSVVFDQPPGQRHLTGIGSSRRSQFLRPWMYDRHIVVDEPDAVASCRRMASQTGIHIGGSSGAVVAACLAYLRDHPETRCPVCVCPDGGATYRETIFDDDWLRENLAGDTPARPPAPAPLLLRGLVRSPALA